MLTAETSLRGPGLIVAKRRWHGRFRAFPTPMAGPPCRALRARAGCCARMRRQPDAERGDGGSDGSGGTTGAEAPAPASKQPIPGGAAVFRLTTTRVSSRTLAMKARDSGCARPVFTRRPHRRASPATARVGTAQAVRGEWAAAREPRVVQGDCPATPEQMGTVGQRMMERAAPSVARRGSPAAAAAPAIRGCGVSRGIFAPANAPWTAAPVGWARASRRRFVAWGPPARLSR